VTVGGGNDRPPTDAPIPSADPMQRLLQATAQLAELRHRLVVVTQVRDRAMEQLHDQGLSYAEIAKVAGTTRGRVAQVVRALRTARHS
jgi:DNA-directed RNA polymerase specialized sigma24 family protein